MTTRTKPRRRITAADRRARFEEAQRMMEEGIAKATHSPENLKAFLAFRARFRSYSFRNVVLIQRQRPNAKFCKGYKQWRAVGRQVRKGERGIKIWVPFYRNPTPEEVEAGHPEDEKVRRFGIGHVFDIEQCEISEDFAGEPLVYQSPSTPLEGSGAEALYAAACQVADAIGYPVEESLDLAKEGDCNFTRHRIRVLGNLPVANKAAVAVHELAHARAHDPRLQPDVRDLSKPAKELQAEGAAFVACYLLGLDTSRVSFGYLRSYETEEEQTQQHFAVIEELGFWLADQIETYLS